MLNQVVMMGRLVKDPELRTTQGGKPVANFTLACDRDLQDAVDFFDCIAWDKTAEFVTKHFFKGKMILVSGSAQTRKYEKDGVKRTSWEINVQRVYFADDKKREDGYAQMDGGPVQYTQRRNPFDDVMSERMDDTYGRMPF